MTDKNQPKVKVQTPKIFLPFENGLRIQVPDSLNLITPYVLREQGDWFEDEIKFLRKILQAGEKIIDIGANYGTYTLSMAKAVGRNGALWAFEPATATSECLRASLRENGFENVILEQSALSSAPGSARLSLNTNSELNAIVRGAPSIDSEEVPVATLDERMDHYGWRDISFMKIDAEGEEENILAGGRRFFASESPLVEFEYKAGREVNEGLAEAFAELGFDSYRLAPGLDILIPFPRGSVPDGYLLNLFCCKSERAAELHKRGILVRSKDIEDACKEEISFNPAHNWRQAMLEFPWAQAFMPQWENSMEHGRSPEMESALDLFFFSRDRTQLPELRVVALERSMKLLQKLCAEQPHFLREGTYARVARDFGARQEAIKALGGLANRILSTKQINTSEPFLLPLLEMDKKSFGGNQANFVFAATLEGLEVLIAFSSFYSGQSSRGRLEVLSKLGLGSDEMARRLNLLNQRFPKAV